MAKTAQQVIDSVRVELGDDKPPYRYENAQLLEFLRQAEMRVAYMRPDALYTGEDIILSLPDPHLPSMNSSTCVREQYYEALVCYVCYKALGIDSEHAANLQLSNGYFTKFGGFMV